MISLDDRSSLLLKKLIKASSPVSAADLSKGLNLTQRKVRYSIKKIELVLNQYGIDLEAKPGLGYKIIASPENLEALRMEILKNQPFTTLSKENRQAVIRYMLLDADAPLILKHFQYCLNTSRTTIINDLNQVETWFTDFQLELVRKQNHGCSIQGKEFNKRLALVTCIIDMVGEIKLLEVIGGVKKVYSSKSRYGVVEIPGIGNIFADFNFQYFVNLATLIQDITSEHYTDKSYILFILHLAVMVKRLQQNKGITEIAPDFLQEIQGKRLSFAATIAENIRHAFNLMISEVEVNYIAFILSQLVIRRSVTSELSDEKFIDFNAQQVFEVVGSILNTASLYIHPALKFDKELIQGLIQHIITFFNPSVSGQAHKNPILEEVRKTYPRIFQISKDSVKPLEDMIERHLNEDEISFFTMHLAAAMEKLKFAPSKKLRAIVVCNAGIATANLLVSRIKTEFPELEVIQTMTYLEYNQHKMAVDFDLVISSVPVEAWEKPTIVVSPLLESRDIKRIRKLVNKLASRNAILPNLSLSSENTLSSLITAETIDLQVSLLNWEQVIDHAGKILLDSQGIEPRYIYAMKRMMIAHGPYMVIAPGIALLHAFPDDGVRKLCMSLVTLKEPISFGHKEYDPVSIVVTLGAPGNETHLQALAELVGLFEDKKALECIKTTMYKANVLKFVSKHSRNTS